MSDTPSHPTPCAGRGPRGRLLAALAAGGLLGTLLGASVTTWARPDEGDAAGRHCRWHRDDSPQAWRERAEKRAEHLLTRAGANEAQRLQVRSILRAAIDDLLPLREAHQQNRQALLRELGRPTVDREALERVRQSEMALAERFSTRLTTAMADAAAVLPAEQRARLVEQMAQWRR